MILAHRALRTGPLRAISAGPAPVLPAGGSLRRWIVDEAWSYHHPVGTCAMGPDPDRGAVVDADCRVHGVEGLSVDLYYESTSDRTANRRNTLEIPARYIVSPGLRYRFSIGDKPATFRAQVASANNVYGYNVIGEGVYYNFPRRFSMSFVADL